jgi:hypothetical protein
MELTLNVGGAGSSPLPGVGKMKAAGNRIQRHGTEVQYTRSYLGIRLANPKLLRDNNVKALLPLRRVATRRVEGDPTAGSTLILARESSRPT